MFITKSSLILNPYSIKNFKLSKFKALLDNAGKQRAESKRLKTSTQIPTLYILLALIVYLS